MKDRNARGKNFNNFIKYSGYNAVPRKGWLGPPYPFSHRGGRGLGAQSRPSLAPSQLGPSITFVITPQPS